MFMELMNRLEDVLFMLRQVRLDEIQDEQPQPEKLGQVITELEEIVGGAS